MELQFPCCECLHTSGVILRKLFIIRSLLASWMVEGRDRQGDGEGGDGEGGDGNGEGGPDGE